MHHLDNITVRPALPEDAAGIAFVHIQGWQESYKGIVDQGYLDSLTQDREARSQRWRKLILEQDENSIILVAKLANEVVGFCSAGPIKEDSASKGELYAIYLLDEFKGIGAGKMLWDKSLEFLTDKKLVPFEVIMLEENVTARKFYEKQGCKFIGELTGKIGGREYKEVRYRFG